MHRPRLSLTEENAAAFADDVLKLTHPDLQTMA